MDYKPLVWLHSVKDPTSRLVRWRLKLAEYKYTVTYKAGKNNVNADALSWNPIPSEQPRVYMMQTTNPTHGETLAPTPNKRTRRIKSTWASQASATVSNIESVDEASPESDLDSNIEDQIEALNKSNSDSSFYSETNTTCDLSNDILEKPELSNVKRAA